MDVYVTASESEMSILIFVNLVLIIGIQGNYVRPIVRTPQGLVCGVPATTWRNRSITNFLGIPYAVPPIGDLRFEPPREHPGWVGILDAKSDGPECIQLDGTQATGSEDCLRLNVFTPTVSGISKGSKSQLHRAQNEMHGTLLPVMVYIFGGAFRWGSQTSDRFNGKYLLDEDMVLVVPNFRMGPFGFLSTGDHVVPGNNGFKDIVQAFRWVQKNIEHFGGDPNQVTMVGQSSGAASVHLLALSPLMAGLMHRYIAQSGSALANWAYIPKDQYKKFAWKLGEFVGCQNNLSSMELVSCLKRSGATDIARTWPQFLRVSPYPDMLWTCTDEPASPGAFMTENPRIMIAAGKARNFTIMTGATKDEGLAYSSCLYTDEDSYHRLITNLEGTLPYLLLYHHLPINQTAYTKELINYYLNDLTAGKHAILSNITALIGDCLYVHPAWTTLRRHVAEASNRVYFYTFDYRGTVSHTFAENKLPEVYGVGHGDELTYLFDEYNYLFKPFNKSFSNTDHDMITKLVPLWASFVKTGVPSTSADPHAPVWKPFDPHQKNILRIGDGLSTAMNVANRFHDERMQFLDGLTAKFC